MDVAGTLGVLRRRWLAVLVCLLAGIAGSLALTRSTEEVYRSSTRLFVNIPTATGVQEALQGVQLSTNLLQSYARIATSRLAAERIVEELDLDEPAAAVAGRLGASVEGNTLLITITAEDTVPAEARALAGAAGDVFIDLVGELEEGRDGAVEARVIDEASAPGKPVRPRPVVNLVVGGLLGLALGVAVALGLEALDRTVKSPTQLGAVTGTPVLGVIRRRRHADEVAKLDEPGESTAEAYRALRTSIRFAGADRPSRTIVVTSPSAKDGKSTTVANLAVALARSGERVIAVDADLRRPRLAALLGVESEPGLTSVLNRQASLEDALVTSPDGVVVLPAGPLPSNPAEMTGSQAMADLLAELEARADIVVIDAPPVLPVTDAVALSTQVDAVVLVVRAGRTKRDAAGEAAGRLTAVGANLLGTVLNGAAKGDASSYGDDYRYAPKKKAKKSKPQPAA
jgi:capsular exopolysaccharide synthesis family protein